MKRIISILLALLTVAGLLAVTSCERGGGKETSAEQTEPETDPPLEDLWIVKGGKTKFRILMPGSCSDDVLSAIKLIPDALKTETGVRIEYTRVDFVKDFKAEDYEILIGDTGREESNDALAKLKPGAYAISRYGNKIVIVGKTEELLVRAISYFAKSAIRKNRVENDKGGTDVKFEGYSYQAEIPLPDFRIAGVPIDHYVIVYAAAEAGYDRPSELLQADIEERCGVKLKVVADNKQAEQKNEILVGPTNRAESAAFAKDHPVGLLEYSMGVSGDKFVINGKPYSCLQAKVEFNAHYLHTDETTVDVPATEIIFKSKKTNKDIPLTEGADIRVMTANILAEFQSWGYSTPVPERAEIFAAVLEVWHPDIIGTQEVSDQWYVYLPKLVGDKYAFLHEKTPDGLVNYSSLMYDKTKYNVVDSGVRYFTTEGVGHIRLVTWAVFEPKAGGQRFILFNTHWCWDTEAHAHQQAYEESVLMKEVFAKYPYPYFCTADYNTKQLTTNYNYFLELTGAVDAKYAAKDAGCLFNVAGGCGDLGIPRGESGNSIDHIFMNPSNIPLKFATVVTNCTCDISDHSPKYVDVKLK